MTLRLKGSKALFGCLFVVANLYSSALRGFEFFESGLRGAQALSPPGAIPLRFVVPSGPGDEAGAVRVTTAHELAQRWASFVAGGEIWKMGDGRWKIGGRRRAMVQVVLHGAPCSCAATTFRRGSAEPWWKASRAWPAATTVEDTGCLSSAAFVMRVSVRIAASVFLRSLKSRGASRRPEHVRRQAARPAASPADSGLGSADDRDAAH